MKINTAILITCHNRKAKTLACLHSLFSSKMSSSVWFDVYLVDDGSTDGTSEAIKESFPGVKIIQGNGNLFWNKGMHLAWKVASQTTDFDFYIWLNDDMLLFEDALMNILADSVKMKNQALICGSTKSKRTDKITYGGKDIKGKLICPDQSLQPCFYINGNYVLVPKAVYEKIGMLDPIFIHAIGDYDYGLRAKKASIPVLVGSTYYGYCESNANLPKWCLYQTPILVRFKSLYSPLGNSHPKYYFIFEYRHFGIIRATFHFLTIHLRVLFPKLWKN